MILPEPRGDRLNQRGIAFLSTVLLAIVLYTILSFSGISIKEANRVVVREINLNGLLASDIKSGSVDPSAKSTALHLLAAGTTMGEVENQSEELMAEQPGEIDAPDVENVPQQSGGANSTSTTTLTRPQGQTISSEPGQNEKNTTPGATGTTNSRPSTQTRSTVSSTTPGLPTIQRRPLAAFGGDYEKLDIREITTWMQNNPAELPKGVRQLVRYRPTFLSSMASFNMDGKTYELYMMCKESLFEVHVVLVDDDQAMYLIDRSFQKLSTYLRQGQVRRTADQEIVAVRSNMASSPSSDEFYGLFLSWWDWARVNAQNPS